MIDCTYNGSCTECKHVFAPKNEAEEDWWDSQEQCPDCKADLPKLVDSGEKC